MTLASNKARLTPVIANAGKHALWKHTFVEEKVMHLGKCIVFEVRDKENQTFNLIGTTAKTSLRKLLQENKELCEEN